jgi:DNA (cytosine-5)-methyltransferase 1
MTAEIRALGEGLVLSLFPGIGLLDMAFEEEGFTVVRGPDLLWGGDIRSFHVPAGRFDGVIGGPPCQFASSLVQMVRAQGGRVADNLIPEFERVVSEARPRWYLMENVPDAPAPYIDGYKEQGNIIEDHWVGGVTMRRRRFTFGDRRARRWGPSFHIETSALHRADPELAVTSCAREDRFGRPKHLIAGKMRVCSTRGPRLPVAEMARRQGLPDHFFGPNTPFTVEAQRKMIANGVPIAMGRAVAKAVKAALASKDLAA